MNGDTTLSSHCRREMKDDGLTSLDVMNVLRRGKIVREPELHESGAWRYRIQADRIVVIVEFKSGEEFVAVTAWKGDRQ